MTTTIRFRIRKELDTATARKVLQLKGSLIAQSYTDIIHFDDDGEEFYIHYFTTETLKKEQAISYISEYVTDNSLDEKVVLVL